MMARRHVNTPNRTRSLPSWWRTSGPTERPGSRDDRLIDLGAVRAPEGVAITRRASSTFTGENAPQRRPARRPPAFASSCPPMPTRTAASAALSPNQATPPAGWRANRFLPVQSALSCTSPAPTCALDGAAVALTATLASREARRCPVYASSAYLVKACRFLQTGILHRPFPTGSSATTRVQRRSRRPPAGAQACAGGASSRDASRDARRHVHGAARRRHG